MMKSGTHKLHKSHHIDSTTTPHTSSSAQPTFKCCLISPLPLHSPTWYSFCTLLSSLFCAPTHHHIAPPSLLPRLILHPSLPHPWYYRTYSTLTTPHHLLGFDHSHNETWQNLLPPCFFSHLTTHPSYTWHVPPKPPLPTHSMTILLLAHPPRADKRQHFVPAGGDLVQNKNKICNLIHNIVQQISHPHQRATHLTHITTHHHKSPRALGPDSIFDCNWCESELIQWVLYGVIMNICTVLMWLWWLMMMS